MTQPPAIILDADQVLLDYIPHFIRYLEERHAVRPVIPWSEETEYNLTNMFPDLAGGGLRPYIVAMARDWQYYASIPFLDGAEAGLAALRGLLPGTPFICVTSGGDDPETRKMRLRNLEALDLDDVITLPLGSSKENVLKGFPLGCWFVDDMPRHVAEAEAAGHRGILFHHRYNAEADVARRADDWDGVVSIIARQPLLAASNP